MVPHNHGPGRRISTGREIIFRKVAGRRGKPARGGFPVLTLARRRGKVALDFPLPTA